MTLLPTAPMTLYTGAVSSLKIAYDGRYTAMFNVSSTQIMVTTSEDGKTWTTPVIAYTNSNGAQLLSLIVSETTHARSIAVRSGSAVNLLDATGATLTSWGTSRALPATTTSVTFTGGMFYAATVDGAQVTIHRSTSGSSMNKVDVLSQLNQVPNKEGVISSDLHVVFRESDYDDYDSMDRILAAEVGKGLTTPVLTGAVLKDATTGAFIYHDMTGARAFWGWMERVDGRWLRRWTFSRDGVPGDGGIAATDDGYAIAYVLDGQVHFLKMEPIHEQISPVAPLPKQAAKPNPDTLDNYTIEMSFGSQWIDISDGVNYKVSSQNFGENSTQTWRKITAQSPHYDGTYLIHATKENVTQQMSVLVYGQNQNQVTENILLLEDIVSQPAFRVRFTVGNHQEVWSCQQSDYVINRGHVYLHNTMAEFAITIVRMPRVSYSAVI